jgi:hypothetical protein
MFVESNQTYVSEGVREQRPTEKRARGPFGAHEPALKTSKVNLQLALRGRRQGRKEGKARVEHLLLVRPGEESTSLMRLQTTIILDSFFVSFWFTVSYRIRAKSVHLRGYIRDCHDVCVLPSHSLSCGTPQLCPYGTERGSAALS